MNDAPDSQPRLRVGQIVEIKEMSQWRGGVVKNIRGQAFLVMYDGWDQPFHWEWVTRDRIRMPGSNDPGPDPFSQIGEKLNNRSADVALRAFEKKLQARPQPKGEPSPPEDATDAPNDAPTDAPTDAPAPASIPTTPQATPDADADPFGPFPFPHPVTPVDLSAVTNLAIPEVVVWSYEPPEPPEPADNAPRIRPADLRLTMPAREGFPTLVTLNADDRFVVASQTPDRAAPGPIDVVIAPLPSARPARQFTLAEPTAPEWVTADGKRLIGKARGFHAGSKSRIDIWNIQAPKPAHQASFIPYPNDGAKPDDVDSITPAGNDVLITTAFGKPTIAWDMSTLKPLWQIDGARALAVAPSGDAVAITRSDGVIVIIDPKSGKVVGRIDNAGGVNQIAFAHAGKTLVGLGGGLVWQWDMDSGKPFSTISARDLNGLLLPIDDDLILIGNAVYSLRHRQAVAIISTPTSDFITSAGRLWSTTEEFTRDSKRVRHILATQMPSDTLNTQLARLSPARTIELRDGESIRIDVQIDDTPEAQENLKRALIANLSARGVSVRDDAKLTLSVRTEDGKSEDRTYRRIGESATSTVTVTEKITRVRIERDAQTLWQTSTSASAGFFVSVREGQDIQSAVRDAAKADTGYALRVTLPDILPLPATDSPIVIELGKAK